MGNILTFASFKQKDHLRKRIDGIYEVKATFNQNGNYACLSLKLLSDYLPII